MVDVCVEIGARRLYVDLKNCADLIIDKPIAGLKMKFDKDVDGSTCIIVCEAKCEGRAKGFYKTNRIGGSVFISTPSILFPYIGKRVIQYQSHLEVRGGELFRIRPFNFLFTNMRTVKKEYWPYFLKRDSLVIPSAWMLSNGVNPDVTQFISFDMNDRDMIESGVALAEFSYEQINNLQFRMISTIPRRTKRLELLSKLFGECGKQMSRYRYESFVRDDVHKHGLITFKEYHGSRSVRRVSTVRRIIKRNRLNRDHVEKSKEGFGGYKETDVLSRIRRWVRC